MQVNSLNINQYHPSFQTKIIVSNKVFGKLDFDKLQGKNCYSGFPWEIENSVWGKEAYTTGASVCTILRLQSKTFPKLFQAHLIPDNSKFDARANVITDVVEKLRTSTNEDVSAIVTGGNCNGLGSVEQYVKSIRKTQSEIHCPIRAV